MNIEKNASILLGIYFLFIQILIFSRKISRGIPNIYLSFKGFCFWFFIIAGVCILYGVDRNSKLRINIGLLLIFVSSIYLISFNILGSPYLLKNIEIEFYLNLSIYLDKYEYGNWNSASYLMMVWLTFSNYIRFNNVFTFQIIICPMILTCGIILYYYARKAIKILNKGLATYGY
ncbi:MAG: hypothetical protein HWN67_09440 [Candidatus Helarchaeota archaeon]|nr:hypothetical protein [Candidatus Helarchaeota archaeon]